jgi:hypothetical protein
LAHSTTVLTMAKSTLVLLLPLGSPRAPPNLPCSVGDDAANTATPMPTSFDILSQVDGLWKFIPFYIVDPKTSLATIYRSYGICSLARTESRATRRSTSLGMLTGSFEISQIRRPTPRTLCRARGHLVLLVESFNYNIGLELPRDTRRLSTVSRSSKLDPRSSRNYLRLWARFLHCPTWHDFQMQTEYS